MARTDARSAVGLDEACERARMAADLGVDAIFVEAPESIEELEAVAAATPGVVRVANMIEAGRTPLLTPDELHALGFDLIVSPLTGLFAVARSLATAYGVLAAKGTLRDDTDLLTTFDDFNRVVEPRRALQAGGPLPGAGRGVIPEEQLVPDGPQPRSAAGAGLTGSGRCARCATATSACCGRRRSSPTSARGCRRSPSARSSPR